MSLLGEQKWVSMALAADASVGEMALFAKEWLSQSSTSSQQQEQLPVLTMKKSPSKSEGGLVSPDRAKEGFLFSRRNSGHERSVEPEKANEGLPFSGENLARGSDVEQHFQALSLPVDNGKDRAEDEIHPLASTLSPMIKSRYSRSSSNVGGRMDGILPVTSTSSPMVISNCLMSSSNQGRGEDEIPRLTSTCSPLIKSKSSKSSSNQGSLPGLVVAPDGVTLVKDRRKCKPRGILTVGHEMSTSSEGNDGDEEVALPMISPSVATVEWVDDSWNDTLSPQCRTDELASDSSVNSNGVFGPRTALTFDFPLDSKNELGEEDASSNSREAVEFRPKIVPSVQESYEVGESVEGSPGDVIVADSDVSSRPELGHELPPSVRDYSVFTSSTKQQLHLESIQVTSPQKQVVFSDSDYHHPEAQSLHIHQSLQLERRADDSRSPGVKVSEEPCECSSDMISQEHYQTIHLTAGKDEGNEEPSDFRTEKIPHEHSETIRVTVEKDETHLGHAETGSKEMESICPLLSICPSPLQTPENEGSDNADVLLGNLTDLAYARDVPIRTHIHDEGSEILPSELSQRLKHAENQVLVAETLYQLAAENLRKTRTATMMFNSRGHETSHMEAAVSSVSIVTLPTFRIDTSMRDERSPRIEPVPYALSPRVSRQMISRPDLANMEQPLRRIILSGESDLSQEVETLNALVGNVHVEVDDDEVDAIQTTSRGLNDEGQGTEESILALTKKAQRQCRQVSSNYYSNNKSSFRKGQQHRREPYRASSRYNCVGLGTFLATAAAFGFVVISLAMGSCHLCHKSDQYHHYIRPT